MPTKPKGKIPANTTLKDGVLFNTQGDTIRQYVQDEQRFINEPVSGYRPSALSSVLNQSRRSNIEGGLVEPLPTQIPMRQQYGLTGDKEFDSMSQYLPEFGFGSWLKDNAAGLLGGAGSIASAIPIIGSIAGPILSGIGSIVGGAQANKAAQADADAQQLSLDEQAAAQKEQQDLANRQTRAGNIVDQKQINYGSTFENGGELTAYQKAAKAKADQNLERGKELYGPLRGQIDQVLTAAGENYLGRLHPMGTQQNYDKMMVDGRIRNIPPMDDMLMEMQTKLKELSPEAVNKMSDVINSTVFTGKKLHPKKRDGMTLKDFNKWRKENTDISAGEMLKYSNHLRKLNKQGYTFENGGQIGQGLMEQPQITEYSNGQTHDESAIGGIPVDARGNPATTSKQSAVGLTEKGEVTWNGYVFSDKLKIK